MKTARVLAGIIAASIILFSFTVEQPVNNTEEKDVSVLNLKGKVKSYTDKKYNAVEKSGKIQKGEILAKYMVVFNDSGNMTEYSQYNPMELERKDKFSYNDMGKKIEETRYDAQGKLKRKITFKYDDSGNKTEADYFKSDGSSDGKVTTEYDKNGNKTQEEAFSANGDSEGKLAYKYDKNGQKTEQKTYSSDGKMKSKSTYVYDDEGRKLEEDTYDSDGKIFSKELCKYDDNGNMIEHYLYGGNILFTINDLYYKYTYKYEYDATGNWTKKIEYENGVIPKNITERELVYY